MTFIEENKNFFKGCLFPVVSIEKWAALYNLRLDGMFCWQCNKELKAVLPIAIGNTRGIVFEVCGCDYSLSNRPQVRFSSSSEQEREKDKMGANYIYNELIEEEV